MSNVMMDGSQERTAPMNDIDKLQRSSEDDTSGLVSEGRRLLALTALSALTVPLMLLEMWTQVGGWVAWVLGAFAIAAFLLAHMCW